MHHRPILHARRIPGPARESAQMRRQGRVNAPVRAISRQTIHRPATPKGALTLVGRLCDSIAQLPIAILLGLQDCPFEPCNSVGLNSMKRRTRNLPGREERRKERSRLHLGAHKFLVWLQLLAGLEFAK